jgi:hypothetical protein
VGAEVSPTPIGATKRTRTRNALPVFAFFAAAAILMVSVIAPIPVAVADPVAQNPSTGKTQSLTVAGTALPAAAVTRDKYTVTKKIEVATLVLVRPAGKPDPGSAQAIGHDLVLARGWGEDQYSCLVQLFNRESHWNVYASNPSGAYGIPQALPGSKMATVGADWQTNPATQITWGLNYIAGRYGTPCGAWAHSQSSGWY